VRPERRRELVRQLEWTYRVSERRGCAVLRFNRSSHRYRAFRNDQAMLRWRIRSLAAARVRYGYFRIYILLRREGWKINHKRVYRLYRQEGLSMRLRRPRRHVMAAHRAARPAAEFTVDVIGRRFRDKNQTFSEADPEFSWLSTHKAGRIPVKAPIGPLGIGLPPCRYPNNWLVSAGKEGRHETRAI
jgi:HTH-like domain